MAVQTKALVTAKWLAGAIKNGTGPNLRVLDSSWYLPKLKRSAKTDFKRRHIPGAAFFDIDHCSDRSSPLDHMLPPVRAFMEYVGNLGINNDTHVVVYDASDFGAFSAPRVWWMFRVFGHTSVSVLNGGLKNWINEGFSVTDKHSKPESAEYSATLDRMQVKTYEDILDNIETKKFQVVDARPSGRFRGVDPEPRDNTEPGHIPGSISVPFTSLLAPSGLLLPPDELHQRFRQAGVDLNRPICVSCGSGVTACHVALAAHECGQPDVTVYDGAWSEWYTRAVPEHVISEGRGKHRLLKSSYIPDQSKYFYGLDSVHEGNVKTWLGSVIIPGDLICLFCHDISPVEVHRVLGTSSPLLKRLSCGGPTEALDCSDQSTNISNSIYFLSQSSRFAGETLKQCPANSPYQPAGGDNGIENGDNLCDDLGPLVLSSSSIRVVHPRAEVESPDSGFAASSDTQESQGDFDEEEDDLFLSPTGPPAT